MGGEPQKALELLKTLHDEGDLSFQELLLNCLKLVDPHSERIPPLDRHVLHLKVEDALDKEVMNQTGRGALEPTIHGVRS